MVVDAESMANALCEWYRRSKRDLPWRSASPDPYAVWVSEVMLQQTQVASVLPYYQRWMERFPDIEALAGASVDAVLQTWSGLGYYVRARNLHSSAQLIMLQGAGFPKDEVGLTNLPGIGRYTSGAILSIAFQQPVPALDTNARRVLSRMFCVDGDSRSTAREARLWDLAATLVVHDTPGDVNQALMELGAVVCTPRQPSCQCCPVQAVCGAYAVGNPSRWPPPGKSKPMERVHQVCAALVHKSRVLMVRRPPTGLWGGLWEMPRLQVEAAERHTDSAERAVWMCARLRVAVGARIATIKHTVTHHAISLHVYEVTPRDDEAPVLTDSVAWVPLGEIPLFATASPQRRALESVNRHFTRGLTPR